MANSLYRQRNSFPFTIFPVPKYLSPPVVGLDISDHALRLVEMVTSRSGLRLGRQDRIELEKGVILDGDIQDEQKLISVLQELRQKQHLGVVYASLPAEHAYYFKLSVSGVSLGRKEIRSAIEFKLEESVPVSPAEAIFDYTFIEERAGSTTEIAVTVMQRKIVESYVAVLMRAGLAPWMLEVEPEALARAVIPQGDVGVSMIVDVGEFKTVIAIACGRAVLFTAVIDAASDALTTAIEKKLAISHTKAEDLKKQSGFQNTEENKGIYEILAVGISVLRDELIKHADYWSGRLNADGSKNMPIQHVYLCGGGANLKGLPAYLSSALGVDVSLADVWINAFGIHEHIPNITFEESLSFVTSVGLALAHA